MCKFVVEWFEKLCVNGGGDIVIELFKLFLLMVVVYYFGVFEEDWM